MSDRDESFMNSGLTSASLRARQAQKVKDQSDKAAQVHPLRPAAVIVNQLIETEKARSTDLRTWIVDKERLQIDTDALMVAKQLNYEFIINFQTSVNNLLREPRKKKESDNG
jgi:hypothetical protein